MVGYESAVTSIEGSSSCAVSGSVTEAECADKASSRYAERGCRR